MELVITTGERPEPKELNLGSIAEDSINSDPESFVKDLQERAGPTSEFASVESDAVGAETFEIAEGETVTGSVSRSPSEYYLCNYRISTTVCLSHNQKTCSMVFPLQQNNQRRRQPLYHEIIPIYW